MDYIDCETEVSEKLGKAQTFTSDGIGLNTKVKAEGKITSTGASALRKALDAKTFHGKKVKQSTEKVIATKVTYEERISKLSEVDDDTN